jgi:hypothetical protein
MKTFMNVLLISSFFFLGSLTSVEAAKFDVAIKHDKVVTLTGVISEEPRKWVSEDGLFESYNFYLAAGSGTKGDDYVSVDYKTLILGHKVAEMTFKKGDKVTLSGRILKYHKDEIIFQGKMKVNDYSAKELSKFPKK